MLNTLSTINNDILAANVILIIFFLILTVAVSLVAVFIVGRYHALKTEETEKVGKLKTFHVFLIVLAVGIVIRLLLTFVINGYGESYHTSYSIANDVFNVNESFADYTRNYVTVAPLTGYLYTVFSGWGIVLGLGETDVMMRLFVKLPYLLADIALASMIYWVAKKFTNRYVALAFSLLVYLNPLYFVMSSMWGSVYALLVPVLFLTFYYMISKNVFGMCVAAAASCLISSDAVFVVPVVGFYTVYLMVKSVINIVKAKPSFDSVMKDPAYYNVFYAPLCAVLGLAVIYLVALPAYFADGTMTFAAVYNQLFVKPYVSGSSGLYYFGENALSIYSMLTLNFTSLGPNFRSIVFAIIFVVFSAVVSCVFYLMKRNRGNLVLLASYVSVTTAIYMMGASEWSLLPGMTLMLLSFFITKDKRLLKVFSVLSVFVVLNALLVMLGGGQISGDLITEPFKLIDIGALNVFSILLSVLTILVHVYYTVVVVDLALAKHRKPFITDNTATFGDCMKVWIRG